MPPRKRHDGSLTIAFHNVLKVSALLFVGFGFGATMTLTKQVLDDVQLQDVDGRKLSTTATTTAASMDSPSILLRGPLVATSGKMTRPPSFLSEPVRGDNNRRSVDPNVQAYIQRLQSAQDKVPVLTTTIATDDSDSRMNRPRTNKDVDFCRNHVFVTQLPGVTDEELDKSCNQPAAKRFNVCHDLADFTGLTMDEVVVRMARLEHYHFEEEHLFWNPTTPTALAWYYSTSQSYLFANSIHPPRTGLLDRLQKGLHEPVLDYSGGVGNSCLYLAMDRGLKCQYFGIGMIEKSFAQFRVAKRGLQDMVTFLHPWSEATDYKFDPIQGPLPRDGSLGAILAVDVLEHIPAYQHTVAAMVDSLRVGGVIMERTPFADHPVRDDRESDTRIHVYHGGITMEQAMGDRMVFREKEGYWEKIKA
ncbi:expressed unknown protein [Seminavis robusta]|uniref:Uncharacterized protein n=1 Tax=Seminavis robusta TaxID=568900 RepID=A0A9N8HS45_9STRA|nr:expressed unknown protein [Seminavis robusta]|eukprot:Sro1475_g275810.1 n/a (418) ;mRNA; f:6557-7810